jgi:hypothetical protein
MSYVQIIQVDHAHEELLRQEQAQAAAQLRIQQAQEAQREAQRLVAQLASVHVTPQAIEKVIHQFDAISPLQFLHDATHSAAEKVLFTSFTFGQSRTITLDDINTVCHDAFGPLYQHASVEDWQQLKHTSFPLQTLAPQEQQIVEQHSEPIFSYLLNAGSVVGIVYLILEARKLKKKINEQPTGTTYNLEAADIAAIDHSTVNVVEMATKDTRREERLTAVDGGTINKFDIHFHGVKDDEIDSIKFKGIAFERPASGDYFKPVVIVADPNAKVIHAFPYHSDYFCAQDVAGLMTQLADAQTARQIMDTAHQVGVLGPLANEAVPALSKHLQHVDALVQETIVDVLGEIGTDQAADSLLDYATRAPSQVAPNQEAATQLVAKK